MTWDEFDSWLRRLKPGACIPKPESRERYQFLGWVRVGGDECFAYSVANKAIPKWWIRDCLTELMQTGELRTKWFRKTFYGSKDLGGCNFTTIGGLFTMAGVARRAARGLYLRSS